MQNDSQELEIQRPLELDMQELEPLEAPGFWTGAVQTATIASAVTAAYT